MTLIGSPTLFDKEPTFCESLLFIIRYATILVYLFAILVYSRSGMQHFILTCVNYFSDLFPLPYYKRYSLDRSFCCIYLYLGQSYFLLFPLYGRHFLAFFLFIVLLLWSRPSLDHWSILLLFLSLSLSFVRLYLLIDFYSF